MELWGGERVQEGGGIGDWEVCGSLERIISI